MKHINNTKQIAKTTVNKDWLSKNAIKRFRCGAESLKMIRWNYELERISSKENPVQGLEKLRDAFIIQCFTGFAS